MTTITYDEKLDQSWRWALQQMSIDFERRGEVFESVRRLARRLDDLGLPYAMLGELALFEHGFRQSTCDLEVLVTPEVYQAIHDHLAGQGYEVVPSSHGLHFLDVENGVRIEFLVNGRWGYFGETRPPAFPDPVEAGRKGEDGIVCLSLAPLVDVMLTLEMTGGVRRLKKISDVISLMNARKLPLDFAEQLNPYVRDKYVELWTGMQVVYPDAPHP